MQRLPQLVRDPPQSSPDLGQQAVVARDGRWTGQQKARWPRQQQCIHKQPGKEHHQHRQQRSGFGASQREASGGKDQQQRHPHSDDEQDVGAGSGERHFADAVDVADDAKLPGVIVDDGERVGGGADDVQLREAQRQAEPLEDVVHRQGIGGAVEQHHHARIGNQRQQRGITG
jgi:hypothetical protein